MQKEKLLRVTYRMWDDLNMRFISWDNSHLTNWFCMEKFMTCFQVSDENQSYECTLYRLKKLIMFIRDKNLRAVVYARISYVQFWVRIYGLSKKYWRSRILFEIASGVCIWPLRSCSCWCRNFSTLIWRNYGGQRERDMHFMWK
jgi:hypothetical protein